MLDTKNLPLGDDLTTIAQQLGATNINTEDEAIAFCLSMPQEEIRMVALARLYEKYYEITCDYVRLRFRNLEPSDRDQIPDMTFDRIKIFGLTNPIRAQDGSLGAFVTLVCEWEAQTVLEKDKRRRGLFLRKFQKLWYVQRDEADAYRGDAITPQDVDEIADAIQKSLDPEMFPTTSRVMQALTTIFINTNGLQVEGCPSNPSVAAIKKYLDDHGTSLSEEEISHALKVLRARAKRILEENGWEIDLTHSKSKHR